MSKYCGSGPGARVEREPAAANTKEKDDGVPLLFLFVKF